MKKVLFATLLALIVLTTLTLPTVAARPRGINSGLLMDLPLYEGRGTIVHDTAHPGRTLSLNGNVTWQRLPGTRSYCLNFNPLSFLDCPAFATTDLNFQAEDFSIAAWIKLDVVGATEKAILYRGLAVRDGWAFFVSSGEVLSLQTAQGTARYGGRQQTSITNRISANKWYLAGATRSGSSVRLYLNGVDSTFSADTHVNPTYARRELHIGIRDNEVGAPLDGKLGHLRIWGWTVSAQEMLSLYKAERGSFR